MCRSCSLVRCAIVVFSLMLACCNSEHGAAAKSRADEREKAAREKVCTLPEGSASVPSQLALEDVCGCEKVEGDLTLDASLVSDVQCLRSLREVTGKLEIATPLGATSQLSALTGLERLERVHALSLARLDVSDLTPLARLQAANELTLIALERIHDLHGLGRVAWTQFRAERLSELRSLAGLKVAQNAERMLLTNLPALGSLEGLGGKVDHFELTQADSLTDLRGLRADIREFWLSKNAQLRSLEGFVGLAAPPGATPASVRIESNPELESLAGLFRGDRPRLDSVQLTGLPKVQSVDLRAASELRVLVVRTCTALQEIHGLESIEALEVLYLTGLSALQTVPPLPKLQRVVELELLELPMLKSMESLSSLTTLDRLALNYLDALPNLRGLQNVATAQRILLEDVPGLKTLDGLDGLQTVDQLWISNADNLTTLRGLKLQEARELAVRYNDKLQSVEGLETLRKVSTLDVSENPVLTSLRGLSSLHEAEKVFSHLNGKLPQCELDRLMKQLPEATTREFADNGPPGTCTP